jgi:hypothetical protein
LLRQHIAANWENLLAITNQRNFRKLFGNLQGERLVRLPSGLAADHPAIDVLRQKQFYVVRTESAELAEGPKGSHKNKFTFWRERRAGRCKAPRRRRCGSSSRSGNAADARPPPRPGGLPALRIANFYVLSRIEFKAESRQQNVKLFLREPLARISHQVSSRGGADGHGYKARDGRIPQAYSTVRRGIRPSATQ